MAVLDTDDGTRKVRRTDTDDDECENVLVGGLVNASAVPNADNDTTTVTVRRRRVVMVVENRWTRDTERLRLGVRVIVGVFIVWCF